MGVRAEQRAYRDRVVTQAAAELFWELGYQGTTVPAIARRAGVAVGTVAKVGSKDALFVRAVEQGSTAAALAQLRELIGQPGSVTERVGSFLDSMLVRTDAAPDVMRDYFVAYLRSTDHTANRRHTMAVFEAMAVLFDAENHGEGSPARVAAQTLGAASIALSIALLAGMSPLEEARNVLRTMVEATCRPFDSQGADESMSTDGGTA